MTLRTLVLSRRRLLTSAAAVAGSGVFGITPSLAANPIRIGFGMSLSGPLAPGGKQCLLAMEIWKDEVNAKGGLIGRPVELVYYDDQSNPSNVPSIYAKLIDVDKIDLLVSPFATNQIAPAMPIVMQKKLIYMALFGTGVNDDFKYDRYFQILPNGPEFETQPLGRLFRHSDAHGPETADGRHRRRGCGVLAERARRRAREYQAGRTEDRLRPRLSAGKHRLYPDRARHSGGEPGHRLRRIISAGTRLAWCAASTS